MSWRAFVLASALATTASCGNKMELKRVPFDGRNPFTANGEQIANQLKLKGQLASVGASSLDSQYEVVTAKDDTRYFVKGGKVVSYIAAPKGDESKIIYWRYKFKDQLYRESDLPPDGLKGHHLPLRQLVCDALGTGVVYDPNSQTVKRVFHYDQK